MATMTMKKKDLVKRLEDRIAEIEKNFDDRVAEIDAEVVRRQTAKSQIEMLAQWHTDVAAGLADGSITLTASGSLKNAPPKPGSAAARGGYNGGRGYYHPGDHLTTWSEDSLTYYRQNYLDAKVAQVKPVRNALDLIKLATGTTVQVETGDIQRLLG